MNPIGIFRTSANERYMLPRQSGLVRTLGEIKLNPHCNYEQALEDLEGFDKIWVIYLFHRNQHWKPKVTPPRGSVKRGVFATRSPHRPNPIGLSCVDLVEVKGLTLTIANHDLLDETPILDIKPYLVYADAFPNAKQGWLETLEPDLVYAVEWIEAALEQAKAIPDFIAIVENYLTKNPYPAPSNRVTQFGETEFEWAFKTWRIRYSVKETRITIQSIDQIA